MADDKMVETETEEMETDENSTDDRFTNLMWWLIGILAIVLVGVVIWTIGYSHGAEKAELSQEIFKELITAEFSEDEVKYIMNEIFNHHYSITVDFYGNYDVIIHPGHTASSHSRSDSEDSLPEDITFDVIFRVYVQKWELHSYKWPYQECDCGCGCQRLQMA